jgi:hypothetical protein
VLSWPGLDIYFINEPSDEVLHHPKRLLSGQFLEYFLQPLFLTMQSTEDRVVFNAYGDLMAYTLAESTAASR